MQHTEFTSRNVAKFVVRTTIALQTSKLVKKPITDHTQFEEDDNVVTIATGLIGWYVSDKLKPYTDSMVDKTADWIVARRRTKKLAEKPAE